MDRERAARLARERQQQLTKPAGSLGRLEVIAVQLAAIQRNPLPEARPAAALIFAADHPVTAHSVSAYPQEVTRSMLGNLARGGAAAAVLARAVGVPLTVVDVGVAGTPEETVSTPRHPVADHLRGDLRNDDAMSEETAALAMNAGEETVAALESGTRILMLGEIGIGNTTVAAAVAAALLGQEASALVGPGTGVDGKGLQRKIAVVDDALARVARDGPTGPMEILRRLGGPDLAALVGAMRRARTLDMTVLVDGYSVSIAALVACRAEPELREHLVFSHRSAEPGHEIILRELGAEPLLQLGMRLGEATGALTAFPLIEAACLLHAQMATFDEAAVPTALPRTDPR
ncbi:MAG: nicotinate-nucleotide--dimethylbenzimidazole phosphoribosyltransferase [Deltaproteobacteria bacterium]|nr:nicotinate-nucleotide--dimethylbenzimidazole phosphoribosyltransferase [Deltaproteobacteria bacterium]MBW2393786.1 nicotinate-nucleotide--dimethylbenzimidazole phosphoribosyltransferase [Deltaproteobacteria bacterium]